MALLIFNPSDPQHTNVGHAVMDAGDPAAQRCYDLYAAIGAIVVTPLLAITECLCYTYYVYQPRWIEYQWRSAVISIDWLRLCWQWWIIWIAGYWYEPPPGKRKYNGTYWHHNVYEPIFQLRLQ